MIEAVRPQDVLCLGGFARCSMPGLRRWRGSRWPRPQQWRHRRHCHWRGGTLAPSGCRCHHALEVPPPAKRNFTCGVRHNRWNRNVHCWHVFSASIFAVSCQEAAAKRAMDVATAWQVNLQPWHMIEFKRREGCLAVSPDLQGSSPLMPWLAIRPTFYSIKLKLKNTDP